MREVALEYHVTPPEVILPYSTDGNIWTHPIYSTQLCCLKELTFLKMVGYILDSVVNNKFYSVFLHGKYVRK
jgi:hypothetical protein